MFCQLQSRHWTHHRWLQKVSTLLTERHWPPITSCLATITFDYHLYHAQENLLIIESLFDKLKSMQTTYGIDFVKSVCQLFKPLKKAMSFGWSKTAISKVLQVGSSYEDNRWVWRCDSISDSSKERRSLQETGREVRPVIPWNGVLRRKTGQAMWWLSLIIQQQNWIALQSNFKQWGSNSMTSEI